MVRTLYYVEMTSPDQLRPASPLHGVALETAPPGSSIFRPTQEAVGAPHQWPSLQWSDQEWNDWLSDPRRTQMLIQHDGETVGVAELERQERCQVEITSFGLVPEVIGRGIGGPALTQLVARAWALDTLDGQPVRRLWLHTSSAAHTNALPNYLRRGFRLYHTEHDGLFDLSSTAS